jgi:hypothetical protein
MLMSVGRTAAVSGKQLAITMARKVTTNVTTSLIKRQTTKAVNKHYLKDAHKLTDEERENQRKKADYVNIGINSVVSGLVAVADTAIATMATASKSSKTESSDDKKDDGKAGDSSTLWMYL